MCKMCGKKTDGNVCDNCKGILTHLRGKLNRMGKKYTHVDVLYLYHNHSGYTRVGIHRDDVLVRFWTYWGLWLQSEGGVPYTVKRANNWVKKDQCSSLI